MTKRARRNHNPAFRAKVALAAIKGEKKLCCMKQTCRRSYPIPTRGSGNADGDRASKLRHAVERMDGDVHLGRATFVRARAQPVTDHLLEPADGGLCPGSLRVAGRFLPGCASVLGDAV